jgi:hypothetical protein
MNNPSSTEVCTRKCAPSKVLQPVEIGVGDAIDMAAKPASIG